MRRGFQDELRKLLTMSQMPRRVRARIICTDTTGEELWFHGRGGRKAYPRTRTADKNAIIVNGAKSKGRNVFYFEDGVAEPIIREGVRLAMTYPARAKQSLIDAATRAQQALVKRWRQNIAEGRAQSGGMRPLKAPYRKIKDALYPGEPIMRRTGMLERSFAVRIVIE